MACTHIPNVSFVAWTVLKEQGNIKFLRQVLDRRTHRETNRQTPVKQYAPQKLKTDSVVLKMIEYHCKVQMLFYW